MKINVRKPAIINKTPLTLKNGGLPFKNKIQIKPF